MVDPFFRTMPVASVSFNVIVALSASRTTPWTEWDSVKLTVAPFTSKYVSLVVFPSALYHVDFPRV